MMRVAVIGSRCGSADVLPQILENLPSYTSEIISGGADGIDQLAKQAAQTLGIPFREFLPDYATFGRRAPLERNDRIIDYADMVIAFWDGKSKGTKYVIGECLKRSKRVVYIPIETKGD